MAGKQHQLSWWELYEKCLQVAFDLQFGPIRPQSLCSEILCWIFQLEFWGLQRVAVLWAHACCPFHFSHFFTVKVGKVKNRQMEKCLNIYSLRFQTTSRNRLKQHSCGLRRTRWRFWKGSVKAQTGGNLRIVKETQHQPERVADLVKIRPMGQMWSATVFYVALKSFKHVFMS